MSKVNKTIFIWTLVTGLFFSITSAYAGKDLDINLGFQARYDDNIFSDDTNEKEDLLNTFSLGVKKKMEAKYYFLYIDANIAENVYLDNSELTNVSEAFSVQYKTDLSQNMRVSVREAFSHKKEIEEPYDALGKDAGLYSRYNNSLSINGEWDLNKNLRVEITYTNSLNYVSRERDSDSVLHKVKLNGTYFFSSKSILSTAFESSVRSYNPGGSVDQHSLFSTYRYYYTPQLYSDIGFGLDYVNHVKSEIKPLFFTVLTQEIDEQTALSLSLKKEQSAQTYSEDIYERWEGAFSYNKQLSEKVKAAASIYVGTGEFSSGIAEDTLSGVNARILYDLQENIQLNAGYAFRMNKSNINSREYTGNTVSVGCTVKF